MADTTYQPKTYRTDGGDKTVIASGGTLDIEDGGSFEIAGVQVTATAEELNAVSTLEAFTADTGNVGAFDLCYPSGFDTPNSRIKLKPAQADSDNTSNDLYFSRSAVTAGASGNAERHGAFTSTLTNSGAVGDPVFLSAATPGDFTGTQPSGSDIVRQVGTFLTTGSNADIHFDLSGEDIPDHDHSDASTGGTLSSIAGLTGTTEATFTFDSDSAVGKIAMTVVGGGTNHTVTISNTPTTGDITITIPDFTGTLLTHSAGQIQNTITDLTNVAHDHSNAAGGGTLATPALTGTTSNTFDVDSDSVSGVLQVKATTGGSNHTVILTNTTTTAARTLTLPDATDTLVARDTTDTLTNKTLTDPTLDNDLTITNTTVTGTWTDLGTVTTADINGGSIDGVTMGVASPPVVTDIDINGGSIDGVTIGAAAAPTVTDLGSVATCDINGGSIDGTPIGGASPSTANVTTLIVSDGTTPTIALATGKTNTGIFTVFGKTSGSLVVTANDSTAEAVTFTTAAQTTGAGSITIPDLAGNDYVLVHTGGGQTIAGTFRADIIHLGATGGGAGILTIFPTGGGAGRLTITPQDNGGDHTIDIQNDSFGQASVLTIPDPGAGTANFVLDAGTNALGSTDTHTGVLDISGATVTYRAILNGDIGAGAAIARSKLAQDALAKYTVPFTAMRKLDLVTALPTAGDTTNLGLAAGTHGTNGVSLDGAAASGNTQTETVRFLFTLPPEYDAGETVTLRCHARVSTAANTSATLDVECIENDTELGVSGELQAGAAQSINTDSWADKDYTINPAGLVSGDELDVLITTVVNDGGGSTGAQAQIGQVQFLLDIRG